MRLFCADHKLKDIIFREPSVITVLNRFDIYLGVGEQTIDEACKASGHDTAFFLAIINTYLFDDYFPEQILKSFSINQIVEYLQKTDRYYAEFQLPNVERHFNSLVSHSKSHNDINSNLPLLRKFFQEMSNELIWQIDYDRKYLFPKLIAETPLAEAALHVEEEKSLSHTVEEKLSDLLTFFVVHLQGVYDYNLCRAVVTTLFTLEKDVRQNNRIRERILLPLLREIAGKA